MRQSAKRAFARLEGHNDPKRLRPTSQFLSGGCGGMVAQYVAWIQSFKGRSLTVI